MTELSVKCTVVQFGAGQWEQEYLAGPREGNVRRMTSAKNASTRLQEALMHSCEWEDRTRESAEAIKAGLTDAGRTDVLFITGHGAERDEGVTDRGALIRPRIATWNLPPEGQDFFVPLDFLPEKLDVGLIYLNVCYQGPKRLQEWAEAAPNALVLGHSGLADRAYDLPKVCWIADKLAALAEVPRDPVALHHAITGDGAWARNANKLDQELIKKRKQALIRSPDSAPKLEQFQPQWFTHAGSDFVPA